MPSADGLGARQSYALAFLRSSPPPKEGPPLLVPLQGGPIPEPTASPPLDLQAPDYGIPAPAPSVAVARAHAASLVALQGRGSLFRTKISDIAFLGVGMQLYFEFLGDLVLLLSLLSVLAVPALLTNYYGPAGAGSAADLWLASFTLGNQGSKCPSSEDESGGSSAASCVGEKATTTIVYGKTFDSKTVAYVLTLCELLSVALMLAFVHGRMRWKVDRMVEKSKTSDINVARNTVYVTGLPADVEADDVAKFFSKNYELNKQQPRYQVSAVP